MIGYLVGEIIDLDNNKVIVDVRGVGYAVHIGDGYGFLVGQSVTFYIHTHMTQDRITLWGFQSKQELQLFEILISVSGVGTKSAQALLANLGVGRLTQAILSEEAKDLRAPGVGAKTAKKIVLDSKPQVEKLNLGHGVSENATSSSDEASKEVESEVISALVNLGYSHREAESMLQKYDVSAYSSTESLLKAVIAQH